MKSKNNNDIIDIEEIKKIRYSNSGARYRRENANKAVEIIDNEFIYNKEIPEYVLNLLKNFNRNISNEYKIIRTIVDNNRDKDSQILDEIIEVYNSKAISLSAKKKKEGRLSELKAEHDKLYAGTQEFIKIENLLVKTMDVYQDFIFNSVYHNNKFTPKVAISESFETTMAVLNSIYKKMTKSPLYIETIKSNLKDKNDTSVESLLWLNSLVTKNKKLPTKAQTRTESVKKDEPAKGPEISL